ncbi:glycosyltransferase family 4 protein [Bradyrhizobium sp. JR3.5]
MTLVQKDRDSDFQLQLAFLREFQRAHNRPLRVLHIGNIANNAYNNALIQRRFGIEADVICYNYYHVMGCPEWEAASFDGNVDNMFPDWWATELSGWRRPDWFVQGPVLDCLSYLRAKDAGDSAAAAFFWTLLQARYWEMLDGIAAAESRVRPPMPEHLADTISIAREFQDFQASTAIPQPLDQPTIVLPGATIGPESALSPISSASSKLASPDPQPWQSRSLANEYPNPEAPGRLVSTYRSLLAKYVFAHLRREAETGVVDGSSLAVAIWRSQRRSRGLPRFGFEFSADVFTMSNPDTAPPAASEGNQYRTFRGSRSSSPKGPSRLVSIYRSLLTKYVFVHLQREAETGVVGGSSLAVAIWRSQRRSRGLPRFGFEFPADAFTIPNPVTATPTTSNGAAADVGSSVIPVVTHPDIVDRPEFRYFEKYGKGEDRNATQRAALLGDLLRQFTDYPAEALVLVEAFASTIANEFADVLEHYDIIQGYSIDGFIPFINGLKNYTCYEHGTLRELPFERTYNGILCSASYKNAAFSFVTNSDVLPSVARLKAKRERTVYLPHAFDDEKISSFRAGLKLPKRDFKVTTFFSPSRHHWHAAPVSMQKGNDLFLRAAAQVAQTDRDFRIILVEWGVDVHRSKELIQELRIEDMVSWIPSLNKAELRQLYCSSDVVVDQFRIPAIGGVTFEAMALGRRVITNLDETQSAEFFGAAPPCLAADSVETCAARILEVLADPLDGNGRGDAARLWFEKCHSAQRVVALQLAAYRTICAA